MRWTFRLTLLAINVAALLSAADRVEAADFVVSAAPAPRISTIQISGEIQKGDDVKFRSALNGVLPLLGVVILESPGGNLQAGLEIGREIRARAYSTLVKAGSTCASSCALVWLAGDRRYMAPGAKIGFHAAYTKEGNTLIEKGAANALIGAYLSKIKLPDEAIAYVTQASPSEVQWLSVDASMQVGINLWIAGENGE